jgi:uncharacterized Zn-finger protein
MHRAWIHLESSRDLPLASTLVSGRMVLWSPFVVLSNLIEPPNPAWRFIIAGLAPAPAQVDRMATPSRPLSDFAHRLPFVSASSFRRLCTSSSIRFSTSSSLRFHTRLLSVQSFMLVTIGPFRLLRHGLCTPSSRRSSSVRHEDA